jgi:gentisate 1,2-dioxygenase
MGLDDLDRELEERNLEGFWAVERSLIPEPEPTVAPHVWKWREIYESLNRAGDLVGLEKSERRTVRLVNPGLKDNVRSATRTIHLSVQLVKPGEIARAHRHTMTAIRFVVQGQGAHTTVEGEQFFMAPGDLILTPNWSWHDHFNGSAGPIIWLDGHDGPLINHLEAGFVEPFSARQQPIERPQDFSARQFGLARPPWNAAATKNPPLRYAWSETYPALRALAASGGDPCDGVLLRYVNPLSGGWTLPTMSCEIQMLRAGEQTRAHRHTSATIYHAFRGGGATEINGKNFAWEQGDCFVVPLWSTHRHRNASDKNEAILFSINDRPMMESLDLYREEAAK